MFQILHRDGLSRIGELEVNNKKLTTPVLLPVIHPFKAEPWISAIKKMKLGGVITNSYTLKKGGFQEGKSVHDLINFQGLVMTDSGTFQEHMYGELKEGNIEMVNYQKSIGSDVITIRDIFSEMDHSRDKIKGDIEENYRRGKEAINKIGGYIALPVHGGPFNDLRQESATMMGALDGEYFPIGGIVPFMERYMYSQVIDAVLNSKMKLRTSAVIHAFGAGHPMFFPLLFLAGVDVIDSSAYIKYARDDRILTETGTADLKSFADELPPSPYFDRYNAKELMAMSKEEREITIGLHNLYVSVKEVENIRQQIRSENIWNYAEYRSHSHPLLLEAFRRFLEYWEYTERFEPLSRKTPLFYSGEESLMRPDVRRFISMCAKNVEGERIGKKPYSYYTEVPVEYVNTPFGTVPLYLDETYPVAQSLFPGEYYESYREIEKFDRPEWKEFLLNKVDYVFSYQFGRSLFSIIEKGKVELQRSRNTGKIRNVLYDGKQILAFRASDGLFSLNYEGAVMIHSSFKSPGHRVIVNSEVSEYIREGKNVFAKFVEGADGSIRPHDEVLIVDREDNLLAFGRALLNSDEMIDFSRGIAVKNRIRSKDSS